MIGLRLSCDAAVRAGFLAAVLLAWLLAARSMPSYLIPSPLVVAQDIWDRFQEQVRAFLPGQSANIENAGIVASDGVLRPDPFSIHVEVEAVISHAIVKRRELCVRDVVQAVQFFTKCLRYANNPVGHERTSPLDITNTA